MPEWLPWAFLGIAGLGMCMLLALVLVLTRVLHHATHRLVRTVEVLTQIVAEIRAPGSTQAVTASPMTRLDVEGLLESFEETDTV